MDPECAGGAGRGGGPSRAKFPLSPLERERLSSVAAAAMELVTTAESEEGGDGGDDEAAAAIVLMELN